MLQLTRKDRQITIETAAGRLAIDGNRGGQITDLVVKDEIDSHPLLNRRGHPIPDLTFELDGQHVALSGAVSSLDIVVKESDFVRIRTGAALHGGTVVVEQEYEIHEEGLLFTHLLIEIAPGATVKVSDCSMDVGLDLASTSRGRWGRYMRDYTFKRDFTSLHALPMFKGFLPIDESQDAAELMPMISLDLGWEATRFFSNHLEFFLEDWAALGDGPRQSQTSTRVCRESGNWQLKWRLFQGPAATLSGPYRYRNRWGIAFGRARTAAGADADPAIRNNAMGSKICHLKVPYGRKGYRWPWVSMPIKQVAEQSDQLFVENPPVSCVDEAADLGADLMIIHQFWMENPGSNNEPVADYQPKDPAWLKAFIERCHQRGMRVMLYVRGTEMWCQFSPFFEQFLERNRDGLYVDWNTPFSMGAVRCSPMHVSLHNYFHFTKALRERVGPAGLLIGHAGFSNYLSLAAFDVLLGGETSVRHTELLENAESAAYFALLDCCGAHLIGGNMGDRSAFAGAKAGAICAALGMTSQVNMEPGTSFADRVAFIKPLWDAMSQLTGRINRYHNPAYIPTRALICESPELYPSLWQTDNGQALLLVTNMGAKDVSGSIKLNLNQLDVPAGAPVKVLPLDGIHQGARVSGDTLSIDRLPNCKYTAIMIGNRK